MTHRKRTPSRKTKATASKKPPKTSARVPETEVVAQWMQSWLDPKTYEDFDVPGHAKTLQNTTVDHAEAMTRCVSSFIEDRLNKDFAAMRDLAACTDFADYVRIQSGFWQTAWDDYNNQMMRYGDLVRDMAEDTDETLCESSDDAAKVIRKKATLDI